MYLTRIRRRLRSRWRYNRKQLLAKFGENLISWAYRLSWHTTLNRNWRLKNRELDIVAVRQRRLKIIEVKTKIIRGTKFSAASQMTPHKIDAVRKSALLYARTNRIALQQRRIKSLQIDFASVEIYIKWIPSITIKIYRSYASPTLDFFEWVSGE